MLEIPIEQASAEELQALQSKIKERLTTMRSQQAAEALKMVREKIAEFGFTPDVVFSETKKGPLPARYRDPASGLEWAGRGKTPRWMQGRDTSEFLIDRK